jgi:hypothetical protein
MIFFRLPTGRRHHNTVVTQQLEGLPALASSGVVIDCKSVHLSSILSRLGVIWTGKLRL